MNPQEVSAYITGLIRSGPEIATAFVMGMLLTAVLVFWVRRFVFPGREAELQLSLAKTNISLREIEISQKQALIATLEAKLADVGAALRKREEALSDTGKDLAVLALRESALVAQLAANAAQRDGLQAENIRLTEGGLSLEQVNAALRTELRYAQEKVAHLARWLRRMEEENATLTDKESVAGG